MEQKKGYVFELMDAGGPTDVREPYFMEADNVYGTRLYRHRLRRPRRKGTGTEFPRRGETVAFWEMEMTKHLITP